MGDLIHVDVDISEDDFVDAAGCERCGEPGELVIDPYALELYAEEVEMVLCEDCLEQRYNDI